MKELSGHLQEQMASISDLQEESAALGRTVRSLQARCMAWQQVWICILSILEGACNQAISSC